MSLWTDLLGGAQAVTVAASATHAVTTSVAASGKIVVVFGGSGAATAASVTDSAGNTYSQVAAQYSGGHWIAMFAADGSLASGGTITCTATGASPTAWVAAAYSKTGLATGAADASNAQNKTATHQPSMTATTTAANDTLLGASHVSGTETFTADWSALGYATVSGHALFTEEMTAATAGVQTYAPTESDTLNAVSSVMAAFAPGAASPQTLLAGKVPSGSAVRGANLSGSGAASLLAGKVASSGTVRGANLTVSAAHLLAGKVSSTGAVRGATLAGSGAATVLAGKVASTAAVRGANLVPAAATLRAGHVASSSAVRGANLSPAPVALLAGKIASTAAVRGVGLIQTVHVGKITRPMAFATRRGVSYMKRNAGLAAGTDSTTDATITAPWISAVSLYLRWLQFEATRGTFTWDNVAASALEAKTNSRKLILRFSIGNDAPAHVYSDFAGPNGGVSKVTLNSGAYVQPAVWEQAWRTEYVRLYTAINALLATPLTDGSGEKIGDYCIGVTIGSASQDNPEMASTTQFKAAGNSAAIATALNGTTAAMDGQTGKGGQATYSARLIQLLANAWEWGIQWHLANVSLCPSILAFGTIGVRNDTDTGTTSDSDVNQQTFAGRYMGGASAGKIIGLVTNYSPTVSGTGSTAAQPGTPYYQDRANGEHVSIDICRQVGGAYAFQFDVSPMNAMTDPTPGNSLALMLYGGATLAGDGLFYRGNVPSYYDDVRYIEVGPGLFGKNDTELQNTITAMRRTPSQVVRPAYLSFPGLSLSAGKVSSGSAVRGATLAGAGAATLSAGKVSSTAAVRGANLAGSGAVALPAGHVSSTQTVRGANLSPSGAAPLHPGKVASTAVVRGVTLVPAGVIAAGKVASGAVVRGATLRGSGVVPLSAGHVSSSSTVRGASLAPGPVALLAGKVASSQTVRGVLLSPGPVALPVGKVASASRVYGANVVRDTKSQSITGTVGAVEGDGGIVGEAGRSAVVGVPSGYGGAT